MKDKMRVYHGIPKSVPGNNTVFYASLDNSVIPEIGSFAKASRYSFAKTPTGLGLSTLWETALTSTEFKIEGEVTYDFYIKAPEVTNSGAYLLNSLKLSSTDRCLLYVTLEGSTKNLVFGVDNNTMKYAVAPSVYSKGMFVRFIAYNELTEFKIFVNGKLYSSGKNPNPTIFAHKSFNIVFGKGHRPDWSGHECILSDIHVSNVSMGDTFINLPQDYIDGKAVIRDRLNQQQIKGDPLTYQNTELIVPNNVNKRLYNPSDRDTDGLSRCYNSPELLTTGASTWNNTSKIRIIGLNREIIGGVIDPDTAFCRVIRYVSTQSFIVDSIDKLQVGDSFKMIHRSFTQNDSYTRTITSIDPSTKTITFSGNEVNSNAIATGWDTLVETTASSSAPLVKSNDGQTVTGSWDGLGTNKATFTLGENTPNLLGKDLYINYSLIMPNNNSDFAQIPYSVDKAFEMSGIEMEPTTEVIIEDDFRYKVSGSMDVCPHTFRYYLSGSGAEPNPNSPGLEEAQAPYDRIAISDGVCHAQSSGKANGTTIFGIFEFDLISMIESKLGVPIPGDKVKWVKDNVVSHKITHRGYGSYFEGNTLKFKVKNAGTWTGSWTNTSSAIRDCVMTWTGHGNKDDGKITLLAYTNPASNDTESYIYTDHIKLEITLKTPENFQAMYCKNTRAREDICNPVLTQKETKTLMRLLPSTKCFVTESKIGTNKVEKIGEFLATTPKCLARKFSGVDLTTYGTGDYVVNSKTNKYLCSCIAKLNPMIDSSLFTGDILAETLTSEYAVNFRSEHRYIDDIHCVSNLDNRSATIFDLKKYNVRNAVSIKPYLVNIEGEVKLDIYYTIFLNGSYSTEDFIRLSIPNKPLIK